MKRLSGSRLILSLSLSLSFAITESVGINLICPNPGNAVLAAESTATKGDKEVNLDEMWKDDSIEKSTDDSGQVKKKTEGKSPQTVDTDTDFKIVMPEGGVDTTTTSEGEETSTEAREEESPSDEKAQEKTEENATQLPPGEKKIKPLCTTEHLKGSVFVKSGGWPGVGPFKTGDGDELVDQYKNRLQYKAEGNQIQEAQLKLANRGAGSKAGVDQLLSVQMAADFFLEALGARGSKIADFNSVLEEKQEFITDQQSNPDKLTLNAGFYEVSIEKDGSGSDGELTISVKNTEVYDASNKGTASDELDSNPVDSELSQKEKENENENENGNDTGDDTSDLAPNPNGVKPKTSLASSSTDSDSGSGSVLDKPITYSNVTSDDDDDDDDDQDDKLLAIKPGGDIQPGSEEKDLLKRQFINLITTWQSIKRRAVKNRQKENLTRILGGKALATQSQAIKFLLDKHRYYEMTPGTMTVESYKAITPNRKYEVVAKINERRRYIDADTLSVLKDENTNYTVSYVVEQIRGQWLITDSKVVN